MLCYYRDMQTHYLVTAVYTTVSLAAATRKQLGEHVVSRAVTEQQ
jgi:hypothetical protein